MKTLHLTSTEAKDLTALLSTSENECFTSILAKIEGLKQTPIDKSYWNDNGIYQNEFTELWKLVPYRGEADTVHGEIIRSAGRLFYEYHNNGNLNARKMATRKKECDCDECDGLDGDCEYCYGSGSYTEEEKIFEGVDETYQGLLNFISEHLTKVLDEEAEKMISSVKSVIEEYNYGDRKMYESSIMNRYDKLIDGVIWFCLVTENSPIK